jgi:UDP-GlcNAc:undecaprenyl-phosphate/decaprenyl-phosphate GlcNAc-1-phosphate transferase
MQIIMVGLCTFLLGLALTMLARKAAHRTGLVAAPRQDRWHSKPTALLGGVAIYSAFVIGYAFFMPQLPASYPILAGGSLLFFMGLVDDAIQIKPYAKLVIQLIAAAMAVYFGLHLPWVNYQWVNDLLTIFWLVGITNAINLLDNMDGLAGGISFISCMFLTITFLLDGQMPEAMLPALLGGAVLGFLAFNFSPASIFMGDCGSMFLGFMLSGTALLGATGRFRNLSSVLLTPVLILMIPIFDTCMVTITRKLSGRKISQGGRDHASHRLVALGVSERRAVLMLYLFAAVSGALALTVRLLDTTVILALIPGFALAVILLGLYLGKVRVYEEGAPQPQGYRIINAIAGFSYKRRVFEVLLDAALVALAYYVAYVLRWDGNLPDEQLAIFMKTLPLVLMVEMTLLLVGGVYRGLWRYAGVKDLLVMAKSVMAGAVASAAVVLLLYRFHGPSRAVLLLNALLLAVFLMASRLSFRLMRELIEGGASFHPEAKPVLIYGAGDGGELLMREILNNPNHRYAPVGFIDDDNRKAGKLIHGYRIFRSSQLSEVIHTYGISEILISSLKVPESKLESLRGLGVALKKMSIRIE